MIRTQPKDKNGFFSFFTQVQNPVTLCSGELWSIPVVRLAHSADLRSRLRHVSSEPSFAHGTGCSRLVTHPGTGPARQCLISVIWWESVCHHCLAVDMNNRLPQNVHSSANNRILLLRNLPVKPWRISLGTEQWKKKKESQNRYWLPFLFSAEAWVFCPVNNRKTAQRHLCACPFVFNWRKLCLNDQQLLRTCLKTLHARHSHLPRTLTLCCTKLWGFAARKLKNVWSCLAALWSLQQRFP